MQAGRHVLSSHVGGSWFSLQPRRGFLRIARPFKAGFEMNQIRNEPDQYPALKGRAIRRKPLRG